MTYYRYHITDPKNLLRIGYINCENEQQAREQLTQWSESILSLEESPLPMVPLTRYYFKGNRHGEDFEGTMEAVEKREVVTTLTADYGAELYLIMSPEEKDADIVSLTMETQQLISSINKGDENQAVIQDENSPKGFLSSYLNQKIARYMTTVTHTLQSLEGDKRYIEDLSVIHDEYHHAQETSQTIEAAYSSLALVLRELAFIASTMDPTPLQKEIRELEDGAAKLLQLLEKARININVTPASQLKNQQERILQLQAKMREVKHAEGSEIIDFGGNVILLQEMPRILNLLGGGLMMLFVFLISYTHFYTSEYLSSTLPLLSRVMLFFLSIALGFHLLSQYHGNRLARYLAVLSIVTGFLSLVALP